MADEAIGIPKSCPASEPPMKTPPRIHMEDQVNRPMGRPVNTSLERTTISLPCDLKLQVAIHALENGVTISTLVEQVLRERIAAQVKKR